MGSKHSATFQHAVRIDVPKSSVAYLAGDEAIETMLVISSLGLFVVFCALCIVCDEHLVPAVEVFIKQFDVPEEVAAVTLVAFGSAAPEIMLNTGKIFIGFRIHVCTLINPSIVHTWLPYTSLNTHFLLSCLRVVLANILISIMIFMISFSVGAAEQESSLSLPSVLGDPQSVLRLPFLSTYMSYSNFFLIGSAMIAFGLIPSAALLFSHHRTLQIEVWPLLRETVFYLLGLGLFLKVIADSVTEVFEALAMTSGKSKNILVYSSMNISF